MPYVRRTASGRISAVYDRPSRDAKERVRANDPEMLKFLGLAPTQSADATAVLAAPTAVPLDAEPVYQYEAPAPQIQDVADSEDASAYVEAPVGDDGYVDYVEADSTEYAAAVSTAAPAEQVPEPDLPASPTPESAMSEVEHATDFSLPDDMPEELPEAEDDGFGDHFGFAETEDVPSAQEPLAAAEVEPDMGDAPVFEAGDMPSNTAPAAKPRPPAPASAPTTTAEANEPAPAAAGAAPDGSAPETPSDAPAENGKDASGDDSAIQQLDASDMEMARITEDLIDLLIGRNIINFTDFPNMAQRKLINRRALRSNMSALTNLVSDEENIF